MLAVCEKHTPKQHSSFLKSCMEFRGNIFDFLKSSNLKVYCPEHISIYIYVAVWHCHCYCHLNIYIYIWNIFILSAEEKKKTSSTSDLPLSRRPASMLKPNFRGAPEVVSQSQQRFNCLQWNIFIKRIEMDIYHLIPSYLISWMDKYRW